MNTHTTRLEGPTIRDGRVPLPVLQELAGVLHQAALRSLRYRVEGRSSLHAKPDWLNRAACVELVDIKTGSAVLVWEAPTLGEAAPEIYEQLRLWDSRPEPDETAFTVLEDTFRQATQGMADSDVLDRAVLESVADLRRVFHHGVSGITMNGRATREPLVIHKEGLARATALHEDAPAAQPVIVSGVLDELRYRKRAFRLQIPGEHPIEGIIPEELLPKISTLWGRKVTVDAEAHYKPSGAPSHLIATRIVPAGPQDAVWECLPQAPPRSLVALDVQLVRKGPGSALSRVFGAWPGDETEDELADALAALE